MSLDKKHKALLQKLIAGTISDHEQWQLERASLDDPFLADALEGYRLKEVNKDAVSALTKKLQNKNQPTKTRSLLWKRLSIAASLLILMSASFWMFKSNQADMINMSTAQKSAPLKSKANTERVAETQAAEDQILVSEEEEDNSGASFEKLKAEKSARNNDKETEAWADSAVSPKKAKPSTSQAQVQTTPPTTVQEEEVQSLEEALAEYEERFPEEQVMDEIVVLKDSDTLESSADGGQNKVAKEVAKKKAAPIPAYKKTKVVAVPVEPQTDIAILQNVGRIERLPAITKGLIVNSEGQPMPGVEILDTENNKLVETDDAGNFFLPDMNGYVITAFAGYDSMTVAITPNLSIQLQKSSETLSQPHKRLVDMMDDGELRNYYINELNVIFSRNWPICNQSQINNVSQSQGLGGRLKNNTTAHLVISGNGTIDDTTFYDELPESCSSKIQDLLAAAESAQLFIKGRPMNFTYRINF